MQQQIEFDQVETNDSTTVIGWLARSFEVAEQWKGKAAEVFAGINGDSDAARNKLAAILREHFDNLKAKSEVVKRWNKGMTEVEGGYCSCAIDIQSSIS